ncbi:MAG: XRE family transcriptional regulator [Clostridiales bacterium]|nr:MAG: XRE family transcriptional regulator [Clostridiales bacterium]
MVNLNNLFVRIADRGINAKKVSYETGISTGNISDWKSGRSMPTASKLVILADYLDCSVDYLLGRTDNPKVNK